MEISADGICQRTFEEQSRFGVWRSALSEDGQFLYAGGEVMASINGVEPQPLISVSQRHQLLEDSSGFGDMRSLMSTRWAIPLF